MNQTNIWWIRRDIRLYDNAALNAAIQNTEHLMPLFIIEPELMEKAAPKRRTFLLNALADLDQQLKGLGSRLIIRQGPALKVFQALTKSWDDLSIFAHEDFSPFARQRDEEIAAAFNLQRFPGIVLRHPTDVLKSDGNPYIVFTPYKNTWYQGRLPAPTNCIPTPGSLPPLPQGLHSENLPTTKTLDGFPANAEEAQQRLSAFIQDDMHALPEPQRPIKPGWHLQAFPLSPFRAALCQGNLCPGAACFLASQTRSGSGGNPNLDG